MVWLSLLRAILGLATGLTGYLRDKRLIEAGEAKLINRQLNGALDAIRRSNEARSRAASEFDRTDGVPDDKDPNLRD